MSSRSSNPSRLAITGAAALALISCNPDAKVDAVESARAQTTAVTTADPKTDTPDAEVAKADRARAERLQACLKIGAEKYYPLYRQAFDESKGQDPNVATPTFVNFGKNVDTVRLFSDCGVAVQRVIVRLNSTTSAVFKCTDPGADGAWVEREIATPTHVSDTGTTFTFKTLDPEKTPVEWKEAGEECDGAYTLALKNAIRR